MDRMNLADPPRNVPLLVAVRLMFGGPVNQLGWVFAGVGAILMWALLPYVDFFGWYEFRGELKTTPGRIVRCEKTSMSENDVPVYALHYEFADAGDQLRQGVSYQRGRQVEPGTRVTIERPPGRGDVHRIRGMRTRPAPLWTMFTVIFPIVGIVVLVPGFMAGRRGCHLLGEGMVAAGRLIDKQPTNTTINDRRVYRLTFEFTTTDGQVCRAVAKSHTPELLEDQADEPLLYDPLTPARAVMMDALPGRPRIDDAGGIRAGSIAAAWASLLIPAVTIAGYGAKLVSMFIR